jgi:hypothetical protein
MKLDQIITKMEIKPTEPDPVDVLVSPLDLITPSMTSYNVDVQFVDIPSSTRYRVQLSGIRLMMEAELDYVQPDDIEYMRAYLSATSRFLYEGIAGLRDEDYVRLDGFDGQGRMDIEISFEEIVEQLNATQKCKLLMMLAA